ncbi:hypothetical protein NC651_004055 [Populus alba x Populus x berolinensis]|nr:hypothetical protein NC651_004055 [Populus alba x Populus x berolinensis]
MDSYKQKQEYHYSTVAPQEPDAITGIYFAPLNSQAITHITPRKKFAMLTATLHIARPSASTANLAVKPQDQHAMIPISLVVMELSSISMKRVMSNSA